jgi:hypothetical protein
VISANFPLSQLHWLCGRTASGCRTFGGGSPDGRRGGSLWGRRQQPGIERVQTAANPLILGRCVFKRAEPALSAPTALMPLFRAMTATDAPACKLCSTRLALNDRSCCRRVGSPILVPRSMVPTISCWWAPSPCPLHQARCCSDAHRGAMTVLVGLLPTGRACPLTRGCLCRTWHHSCCWSKMRASRFC